LKSQNWSAALSGCARLRWDWKEVSLMTTTTKSIYEMTMYEIDERDAEALHEGLQAALKRMKENGTLPMPYRKAANDNRASTN
jgi:hypothetical protein